MARDAATAHDEAVVAAAAAARAEAGATADAVTAAVRAGAREESGLRRTVLPNGLTVLTDNMPWVRSVAFGAWVRAASVHEPRAKMGVSHLLEHMVFKGTRRRTARDIALSLEVLGGSLDAFTSREHTAFQARVLDEHVRDAAEVIGDIVFEPLLRQRDLELERNVVLEEISMVEDTPDDLVFELHNTALWGEHPYGYSILGTRESVGELSTGDLQNLHDGAYVPSRIVITAAGNVSHDRLIEVLGETGWARDGSPGSGQSEIPAPAAVAPHYSHVDRDVGQTHIVLGTPTVAHADRRRWAIMLASALLGGGMSSRLFQRVREELGLAYSVHSFQAFHADTGMHGVYLATAPETADAAVAVVREELAALSAESFPEPEIAQGKSQLKGQVTLAMESVSARMYRAANVELYDEPYRTLDEILALIDSIGDEEIAGVCRDFLDPAAQTVVTLGRKELLAAGY